MAESWQELKSLLIKVNKESEQVGLKLNIQKTRIMASGPITSWQIDGETVKTVTDFIFLDSKTTADGDCSHEIKRCLFLEKHLFKKSYDQARQHIKKQRHYFSNKGPSSQSYGFSSSHVWMRELDHKESWAPKNWCSWTVVLGEDSWESLGLQDQTSQSWREPTLNIHWKDCYWSSNTLATCCEESTH